MRWLAIFIVACVVLTALRAAIIVLAILLAITILWGVFFRPAEMLGFVAFVAFLGILERYPLPVLALISLLSLVSLLRPPEPSFNQEEEQVRLLVNGRPDQPTG